MPIRNDIESDYIDDTQLVEPVTPSLMLLFGGIDDKQACQVVAWILSANLSPNPPEELTLIINSSGGSLHSAFAIIEAMRGSSIPVKTVGMGQICSAGLLIFMNGVKGGRLITPTCSIMSHQFSTATGGTYHELTNVQKEMNYTHQRILDAYVECTGKNEQYIMKYLLCPHDSWLTPKEAIKHKLADRISGTNINKGEL